jgi:NADH-quinone oxidoreductase subunit L
MAGPTPVSALIHAATMVTAGVYLVARSSVLFALAPTAAMTVAIVGAATALFAATIALVQTDIKKVLAYSTVSQLGFMFVGVGVGAYAAGIFHLMTHAFFKALLFMGAGAVIHAMHQAFHHTHQDWDAQDMRNMGGLRRFMPKTWIFMWIATLAIAGVWPFAGFFSKDEIIWYAAAHAVGPFEFAFTAIWVTLFTAAMLTAFYMTRLMIMTFHGENRSGPGGKHIFEAPAVMWIPLGVLALLSVVGGWINIPDPSPRCRSWAGSPVAHGVAAPLALSHHDAADYIFAANVGELREIGPFGGGEAFWAAVAFAIATAVIVLSTLWLGRQERKPAVETPAYRGFAKVLYNKWYVDEIYDAIVVRPVMNGSRALWRYVDVGIVDRTANGLGSIARGLGWVGSRLQTGNLNVYALAIVAGAVLILLSVVGL